MQDCPYLKTWCALRLSTSAPSRGRGEPHGFQQKMGPYRIRHRGRLSRKINSWQPEIALSDAWADGIEFRAAETRQVRTYPKDSDSAGRSVFRISVSNCQSKPITPVSTAADDHSRRPQPACCETRLGDLGSRRITGGAAFHTGRYSWLPCTETARQAARLESGPKGCFARTTTAKASGSGSPHLASLKVVCCLLHR